MKYMLIAGEASGDLHAAALIEALRRRDPAAQFAIIGGDHMARAAGTAPLIHYRDMAYMGFVDVALHARAVLANLATAKRAVAEWHPDVLIPVDYPSFNLRVAAYASKLGIAVDYYISPKLWAWKAWRLRRLRQVVRQVLCILPFEPRWYAARGYHDAVYVGNPTVEELRHALDNTPSRHEFLQKHRLRDRPVIALLPGSRRSEIAANLPILDAAARRFPGYTIAVAAAPGIDPAIYGRYTRFALVHDDTHALLAHAHAAVVTSGTATLEAAVAGVPQVAVYRSSGSKLVYSLMEKVLTVPYVTLPNLIADAPVIPELLMHRCTPAAVADALAAITPPNAPARAAQLDGYSRIARALGDAPAAARAAAAILKSPPPTPPARGEGPGLQQR